MSQEKAKNAFLTTLRKWLLEKFGRQMTIGRKMKSREAKFAIINGHVPSTLPAG